MSTKDAVARITADSKGLDKGLKEAQKKWRAFGRGLGKGITGSLFGKGGKGPSILGGIKSLAGIGGKGIGGMLGGLKTAAGLGGVGGLAILAGNEAAKTMRFEGALVRLAIASRGAIKNLDAVRSKIFGISNATGVGRENVLAGAQAYIALTGDVKAGMDSMDLFAKVSQATGASMDDIAASAAAMGQSLKIDSSSMEKAFSILIRGGKLGAVELRDFAGLIAGLAPRMERFKGGFGVKSVAELGAALQLTRQGFGNAAEAATGLESLMGAMVLNAKKLERAGVKVYDTAPKTGVKTLRGFLQIVESIGKSKLMKNPTKLIEALGRKEAQQTLLMLTRIPGALRQLSQDTMSANDVAEDSAAWAASTAGRLQIAFERVQNMIADVFTPARIEKFAAALEKVVLLAERAIDKFERLSKWIKGPDSEERQKIDAERKDKFKGYSDEELRVMRERHGSDLIAHEVQAELVRRAVEDMDKTRGAREFARHADELEDQGSGTPALVPVEGQPLEPTKPEYELDPEWTEDPDPGAMIRPELDTITYHDRRTGKDITEVDLARVVAREVARAMANPKVQVFFDRNGNLGAAVSNSPRQRLGPPMPP